MPTVIGTCSHSLDAIAGYAVVRTIDDCAVLDTPVLIDAFNGATSYGHALDRADADRLGDGHLKLRRYARTVTICQCGEVFA